MSLGSVYLQTPPEKALIFLVDVSREAWQCKMLTYLTMVLKTAFQREELNETQIYFYTYDETVHEYDFSGSQVERTILDPSLKNAHAKIQDRFLEEIRVLFGVFRRS